MRIPTQSVRKFNHWSWISTSHECLVSRYRTSTCEPREPSPSVNLVGLLSISFETGAWTTKQQRTQADTACKTERQFLDGGLEAHCHATECGTYSLTHGAAVEPRDAHGSFSLGPQVVAGPGEAVGKQGGSSSGEFLPARLLFLSFLHGHISIITAFVIVGSSCTMKGRIVGSSGHAQVRFNAQE